MDALKKVHTYSNKLKTQTKMKKDIPQALITKVVEMFDKAQELPLNEFKLTPKIDRYFKVSNATKIGNFIGRYVMDKKSDDKHFEVGGYMVLMVLIYYTRYLQIGTILMDNNLTFNELGIPKSLVNKSIEFFDYIAEGYDAFLATDYNEVDVRKLKSLLKRLVGGDNL